MLHPCCLLSVFLLLISINVSAGFKVILHPVQGKSSDDIAQIDTVLARATRYHQLQLPDSALFFAKQALELVSDEMFLRRVKALRLIGAAYVKKVDYLTANTYLSKIPITEAVEDITIQEELATAFNYKGIVTSYLGNYDSAVFYFTCAQKLHLDLGDTVNAAQKLTNIGKMYMHMASYPVAISYFFKARKLMGEDPMSLAILNLNLGQCYVSLKEYTKAKRYALQALKAFTKDGQSVVGIGESHFTLGHIYSELGRSDSCTYHLNRCLSISEAGGNPDGVVEAYYYFSLHYLSTGDWERAVKQAEKAYTRFEQENAKSRALKALLVLAKASFHLQKMGSAFKYAEKGLEMSRELGAKDIEKDFLKLLAELNAVQQDYATAYDYRTAYSVVKDSVLNEEKTRQIANMEALYESEKKEQELALAQAEKKATQAQLEEQKSRILFLIAGLAFTATILTLGIFLYTFLRKNKKIIEAQNKRLVKLNQTKDRFFAIVGHDLRGPISSFAGVNDLIHWYIDKKDLSMLKKLGKNIEKSSEQLDTLLNNLLSWAMTQTGGIPYHPEAIRLKELTSEITALFHHLLEAKHIALDDLTEKDSFVYADRNALLLVLRNLVSNALKFTPTGGKISITSRIIRNQVIVEIKDTGVGIAAEKLERLFQFEEDKSTFGTANEKGTGLGLLLCKEHVELNKGIIEVSSVVNQGTIFTFTIPRLDAAASASSYKEHATSLAMPIPDKIMHTHG